MIAGWNNSVFIFIYFFLLIMNTNELRVTEMEIIRIKEIATKKRSREIVKKKITRLNATTKNYRNR